MQMVRELLVAEMRCVAQLGKRGDLQQLRNDICSLFDNSVVGSKYIYSLEC
jgi:hypothetical protein